MDPDITVITIAPLGQPGTGLTSGEKATILGNLATLNAQKLEDHTGVDATGIGAGKVLLRNPANNGWVIATPPGMATVQDDYATVVSNAGTLNVMNGLQAVNDGSGIASIQPIYGTAAATVAQGNHLHTAADIQRAQFAATGVLSSGSRTLATLNLSYASGIDWVMEAQAFVTGRNNINNGTFNFAIRIGASGTYPEETHEYLTVGGVPTLCEIETSRPFVGGGAITVTVRAIWATGDPVDLRAGRVIVRAWPRR